MWINEWFYHVGVDRIFNIIYIVNHCLFYIILYPMIVSAFYNYIRIFLSINEIGSDKYPLAITFSDLRIGTINKIGGFIISISIPALLMATTVGINGSMMLLYYKEINSITSYLETLIGIPTVVLLSVLLYKCTMKIHFAIVDFKEKLYWDINSEIEIELVKENNLKDFNRITQMNIFYEKLEKIQDWPFDPTSLKKFTVTSLSTLFPIILSLFGINI